MTRRRSIVFFLPTLVTGGAERVMLVLASAFADKGNDVTILLQRRKGKLLDAVPRNVRISVLESKRTLSALLPLTSYLSRERPDILVSSFGHSNIVAILARLLSGSPTRVIACQHAPLSAEIRLHNTRSYRLLPLLYRLFLRFASGIVAVSDGVAADLAKTAGILRQRITTIYNPVITSDFDERMNEPLDHPWFADGAWPVVLGVGRLTEEKDYATLLNAFAMVAQKRDVRLVILGDGPLQDDLMAIARKHGIDGQVALPGFQRNPLPYIRRAAVLVTPSRHEGFGNVLVEALACGTPVVSTQCPGGATEILGNGSYGPLVPVANPYALAKAITATLDNPLPKEILRKRGREFTVGRAVDLYAALFG